MIRLPGRQTRRELLLALIPARIYFMCALFAVFAAVGMTLGAHLTHLVADTFFGVGIPYKVANRLANEASNYAATFRAMPLWFFIGGALTQVATRFNTAVDHFIAWRKQVAADEAKAKAANKRSVHWHYPIPPNYYFEELF
jgi:hypothetical protein